MTWQSELRDLINQQSNQNFSYIEVSQIIRDRPKTDQFDEFLEEIKSIVGNGK